jgi:GNAT superfamily N-acetyltransferase
MEFVVGGDLKVLKRYFKETMGDLDDTAEKIITQDPSHLILWKEGEQILGHAIWHETNTEEHRGGVPRDKEDRELLEKLLGGRRDFVELHELWLKKEYRGKGYGKRFFDFFERFIAERGHGAIVYYTADPAAIAICRSRGYKEAYGIEVLTPSGEETCYIFYLQLKGR